MKKSDENYHLKYLKSKIQCINSYSFSPFDLYMCRWEWNNKFHNEFKRLVSTMSPTPTLTLPTPNDAAQIIGVLGCHALHIYTSNLADHPMPCCHVAAEHLDIDLGLTITLMSIVKWGPPFLLTSHNFSHHKEKLGGTTWKSSLIEKGYSVPLQAYNSYGSGLWWIPSYLFFLLH